MKGQKLIKIECFFMLLIFTATIVNLVIATTICEEATGPNPHCEMVMQNTCDNLWCAPPDECDGVVWLYNYCDDYPGLCWEQWHYFCVSGGHGSVRCRGQKSCWPY